MARVIRVPFLLAWPPKAYSAQVLLPGVILVRRNAHASARLIAHELAHVDQIERMGLVAYWVRYAWLLVRRGYGNHPMEVEARGYETSREQLERARALLTSI